MNATHGMYYFDVFLFIVMIVLLFWNIVLKFKYKKLIGKLHNTLHEARKRGCHEQVAKLQILLDDTIKSRYTVNLMIVAAFLLTIYKAQVIGII